MKIEAWNADGVRVKETFIEDATGEGPAFYARQLLHVDGIVRVEVREEGHEPLVLEEGE